MEKRTTIRAGLLLVTIAGLIMAVTFLANAQGDVDEVSVALKWLPQAQFAGYYVADALGFYEDEKLSVSIIPGGWSGPEPEELVASGAAEFGVTWLGILLEARDRGLPLVNIAQIFQSSGFRYIAWADSGVESPVDLRGRTIEAWFGGNEVPLLALLRKYGIEPGADLTLLSQAFDMDAFLNRSVEAAAAMTYNELNVVRESLIADSLGVGTDELMLLSLEEYRSAKSNVRPDEQLTNFDVNAEGVAMLEDLIFTSETFLSDEAKRDIAVRFVRASLRGWEYARAHPDETIDILLAQDTDGSMRRLHQALMLDEVIDLIWGSDAELGYLDPDLFEQTADIALRFGVIGQPASDAAYTREIWELATGGS